MLWFSSLRVRSVLGKGITLVAISLAVITFYFGTGAAMKVVLSGLFLVGSIILLKRPYGFCLWENKRANGKPGSIQTEKQHPFNPENIEDGPSQEPLTHNVGDLSELPSNYTPGPDNHPGLSVSETKKIIRSVNEHYGNVDKRKN